MRRGDPDWLAYERAGTGEPLVLLHGLGSHRGVFEPVLPALTGHREVIAVDLPGFGGSPPAPGPVDVAALADRLEAFLSGLGIPRPHVGGSSLGGAVALELGRRGAARSVVAFAPAGFWGTPGRLWCRWLLRSARWAARGLAPATGAVARAPWARRAREALPGARHAALPGCGHLPFADDPDACARLLLDGGFRTV